MAVAIAEVLGVMVVAMSALVLVRGAKRYCGPSCFEKYLCMVPSAETHRNEELFPPIEGVN